MKFTVSDAEGLELTATINIYAQQLHQLGQLIFNYKGEGNIDIQDIITQTEKTLNKVKEKALELQEHVIKARTRINE